MRPTFGRYALILTMLAASMPAFATVHNVAVGNYFFDPAELTVAPGDTVIWTNSNGFHNVHHTGNPSLFGNSPAASPWTYVFVFDLPDGDYPYICEVHPTQMMGTITVQSPSSSPEPRALATEIRLDQNFPNPFNSRTVIEFSVPIATHAKVTVLNELGQKVRQLYDGEVQPGTHWLDFDGESLATGLYYYRLETPLTTLTRKMYYLK